MTVNINTQKHQALLDSIRSLGRVAIAYSGGVDSAFLLRAAIDAVGTENVLPVIGDSASYPSREFADALKLAEDLGVTCRVIKTCEMEDERYANNPNNRCYFCKHELFSQIIALAEELGYAVVLDGNNADDIGDWRPGQQAARELGVRSLLIETGMTKEEIRGISRHYGLPTWDKPTSACLASRIPYDTPITAGKLSMVERAENFLRDQGFIQVRVRHHDNLARIEVAPAEINHLFNQDIRDSITRKLREIGYQYITVDLQGYRTGSFNEAMNAE